MGGPRFSARAICKAYPAGKYDLSRKFGARSPMKGCSLSKVASKWERSWALATVMHQSGPRFWKEIGMRAYAT